MAERRVTVNVDISAQGNLSSKLAEAGAAAQRVKAQIESIPGIIHYPAAGPQPGIQPPMQPRVRTPAEQEAYLYGPRPINPADMPRNIAPVVYTPDELEKMRRSANRTPQGGFGLERGATVRELIESGIEPQATRDRFQAPGRRAASISEFLLAGLKPHEPRSPDITRGASITEMLLSGIKPRVPSMEEQARENVAERRQQEQRQRMETRIGREMDFGRFGTAMLGVRDEFEKMRPTMRTVGVAWASGTAAIMGFVRAASPETFNTVTGSLRLLAGEVGITLIPQMVQLSRGLQNAADRFKNLDDGTKGILSNTLFYGTAVAGGTYGLYRLGSALTTATIGLNSFLVKLSIVQPQGAMGALTGGGKLGWAGMLGRVAGAIGIGMLAGEITDVIAPPRNLGMDQIGRSLGGWDVGFLEGGGAARRRMLLAQGADAAAVQRLYESGGLSAGFAGRGELSQEQMRGVRGLGPLGGAGPAISMDLRPQMLSSFADVWSQIQTGSMRGPLEQMQFEQQMRALETLIHAVGEVNASIQNLPAPGA